MSRERPVRYSNYLKTRSCPRLGLGLGTPSHIRSPNLGRIQIEARVSTKRARETKYESKRSAPVCAGPCRSAPVRAGLRRSRKKFSLHMIKVIMFFGDFAVVFLILDR